MSSEWIIVYEKYIKAVEIMSGILSSNVDYVPQVLSRASVEEKLLAESNLIIIGENPPEEGYNLKVCESRYNKELQMILLSGCDDIHTLYGAYDFESRYLPYAKNAEMHNPVYYFNKLFYEPMKETDIHSVPKKKNRGLWTWGHVIYDYKRYIDNMVKLKLNEIIVWNDFLPVNAKEFTEYAHENGIRVIWGFAWGWDTDCLEVDISDLEKMSGSITEKFEKEYAGSGCDGIYFQSFTETDKEDIDGICIAEAVTRLVNMTYEKIISRHPGLEVQFGLHATSVKEKLDYISKVNPGVRIVWEDCGAFPYHYMPSKIEGFEETVEFTEKFSTLRENEKCGVILKGHICLDWSNFRHMKGPGVIGSSPEKARKISEERRAIWRLIQSLWMVNADKAKALIDALPDDAVIAALVEDGAFDSEIRFPTALYAEMLWDGEATTEELILRAAQSPYVVFA